MRSATPDRKSAIFYKTGGTPDGTRVHSPFAEYNDRDRRRHPALDADVEPSRPLNAIACLCLDRVRLDPVGRFRRFEKRIVSGIHWPVNVPSHHRP